MAPTQATRPGGRTAHTTAAVYAAVRTLLNQPDFHNPGFAAIAAESGVHLATLYRRWHTPSALILETLMADLTDNAAIQPTGDLRSDLTFYANKLAAATASPSGLTFLRALIDAAADPDLSHQYVQHLVQPRLDEYDSILSAAGSTTLTGTDVLNHLLAPIYLRALLSAPLLPGNSELDRLVDHLVTLSTSTRPDTP